MKTYIYTRTEKTRSRGGVYVTEYTLKMHQIIRGKALKFVGEDTDSFVSDWQQARDLLKKLKLWPKAADAVDNHGRPLYHYASQLREAGIINVHQL